MPNSPENYPLFTYLWVLGVSVLGAVARFARKYLSGEMETPTVGMLFAEAVISVLIGIVTFWLCEWGNIDGLLSAAIIAMTAHMGTPALIILEKQIRQMWLKKIDS